MQRPGRIALLLALMTLQVMGLPLRAEEPCDAVDAAFKRLIKRYADVAEAALNVDPKPGDALEKARKAAIAGNREATLKVAGITLAMRPHQELFNLAAVRQICGFAERNGLPLHIVTCTYFAALNSIGSRYEKRRLVEQGFDRFKALPADTPGRDAGLDEAMRVLDSCLATRLQ